MREYTGPKSEIVHVAVVPGTPARLAAVDNTTVYLWDLNSPTPVAELRWTESAWGHPVLSVSPDGQWLVAGPAEHLHMCDTSTLLSKPSSRVHMPGLYRAEFVGEQDYLTIIHRLKQGAKLPLLRENWPIAEGRLRRESGRIRFELDDDLADKVSGIDSQDGRRHTALSADGSRFAFTGWHEKGVTVWDAGIGRRLGWIPLRGTTECLALSPDGSRIAIDGGTTVYVHDATSLALLTKWKINHCYVPRLAWSPDGRLLARTDRSTRVRRHDAATGREVSSLGTKRGVATAVSFSPDGLTCATGHRDGLVRIWDVEA